MSTMDWSRASPDEHAKLWKTFDNALSEAYQAQKEGKSHNVDTLDPSNKAIAWLEQIHSENSILDTAWTSADTTPIEIRRKVYNIITEVKHMLNFYFQELRGTFVCVVMHMFKMGKCRQGGLLTGPV